MARLGRAAKQAKRGDKTPSPASNPKHTAKNTGNLPLASGPLSATNLVVADIVLRAAGGLLRNRLEKGMLIKSYDATKAEKRAGTHALASSVVLWGASRLATRSPLGLAVVAGGLAAKLLYERGKRVENRIARKAKPAASEPEA